MRVTEDEADAMAAACPESKCWAGPGQFCKTPSGTRRRPHPDRVRAARGLGLLGGTGKGLLAEARQAVVEAGQMRVAGVVLILPGVTADAG